MIRNLISRLTMIKSGKLIYDTVIKKNYIIGQIVILMNILQKIDLVKE